MKLNVLRLVIVSLACATAFVVITRVRAQKSFPVQKQFANSSFALGAPKPAQTPVRVGRQGGVQVGHGQQQHLAAGQRPARCGG